MKRSRYISPLKQYDFPKDLVSITHEGKIIIVSPSLGNWIVLSNSKQEQFLHLLTTHPLNIALEKFKGGVEDARAVLVQVEGRQLESKEVHFSTEFSCQINLTNSCNLLCPHCFMKAGSPLENELTTAEIKKFLQQLKLFGISQVAFSGGEVTMRPDLIDLIDSAYEAGLKIDILTNGVSWSTKMIDQIASKISAVQVSIDGYSEEENAKIRGKGSFEKALNTLDRFLNHGVSCRVAITPFPSNDLINKSGSYVKFARNLRSRYSTLPLRIVFTSGIMDGRNLELTDDERQRYHEIMMGMSSQYLEEDAKDYPFILSARKHLIMDNCGFGSLYVSANGDVKMCNKSFVKPIANLRNIEIDELIELSLRARNNSNINNIEPCNKCPIKYICGGGCRVDEFPELRDGLEPDLIPKRTCTIEHKKDMYDLMIRTNEQIFQ